MDVDPGSRDEIEKAAARILREAGIKAPPVRVEELLEHLRVHREFYSLEDPNLLQRLQHKVQVHGHRLIGVVKKVRLAAVWLPDESRILVDHSLPMPKKEWASFHDVTHSILEWHRPFFLGDTAQTLDPDFHEALEAEANYGASELMFCGQLFTRDALDTVPEWASVDALKKRYQKSWVTTLRRYVEHSHDIPMAMMVSTPWWKTKLEDQSSRCRHFVISPKFAQEFDTAVAAALLKEVDDNTRQRIGGIVGEFQVRLMDESGQSHEFRAESFFNRHYILTLFVHQRRLSRTSVDLNVLRNQQVS